MKKSLFLASFYLGGMVLAADSAIEANCELPTGPWSTTCLTPSVSMSQKTCVLSASCVDSQKWNSLSTQYEWDKNDPTPVLSNCSGKLTAGSYCPGSANDPNIIIHEQCSTPSGTWNKTCFNPSLIRDLKNRTCNLSATCEAPYSNYLSTSYTWQLADPTPKLNNCNGALQTGSCSS